MTNQNCNIAIPRTDRFMERFNARMRFFLGRDVRLDREYRGWDTVDGERYDGACRTLGYDGGCLYVFERDVRGVAVLWGDMADCDGRLAADRRLRHYCVPELRERVERHMEEIGVSEYTPEIGRRALWVKMAPQSLIRERVRVYEMTRDFR